MSWMDSASGSSTFHGGGDHAGNNGPSGAGTGGRPGNGGNNYSQTGGLGGGLGTGTTWHGNTAFGPAGGNAVGYVSLKDGGSIFQGQRGMGPSVNTYSNFRNPDGTPMVGGNLQNTSVTARNPQQALAQLQAMQQGQQQGQQGNNVQGLLSNDDVTVAPTNQTTVVPPTAEPWAWANPAVINPYPQWSGAGSWFAGPNYINAGPNGPVWSGGFPTRQYKGDRESTATRGDLPSNINSIGTAYGRFY